MQREQFFLILFIFFWNSLLAADTRYYNPEEIFQAPVSSGKVYYVDGAGGNDADTGLSEAGAFKTISKAVDRYGPLEAGDTVLIKAGIYRESFSVVQSGEPGKRITLGSFGDGEVIIDGSRQLTGWTVHSGNIYKTSCDFAPTAVVVDDIPYFPEWDSAADINQGGKWHYNSETATLYLWVKDNYNPAARDVIVVADSAYDNGVTIQNAHHVMLYGLTVRGAAGHGLSILGNHTRIEKCNLKFNGKAGLSIFQYGNTLSEKAEVIKNHIYHNCLRNWPRGRYKWGGWPMGAVSHSTPGIRFAGNISYKNGGEGLGAYSGLGGSIFEDNLVFDNWSVNIYVDNQPNALVRRNFIFCRDPDPGDLYNNQDADPSDNRNLKRLRAEGIYTADEVYGETSSANFRDAVIVNNIIIYCRRGIGHYGQAEGSGLKNTLIANNTIIVPNAEPPDGFYSGLLIPGNNGNNSNTIYANNIIYAAHPESYLLRGPESWTGGIVLKNNSWYHTSRSNPFFWEGSSRTYSEWKTASNQGTLSIYGDPRIAGADLEKLGFVDLQELRNFTNPIFLKLTKDSPLVDQGTDLSTREVTDDFFGNLRRAGFDIGAHEYIFDSLSPQAPAGLRMSK
jgi:hypothetical protein